MRLEHVVMGGAIVSLIVLVVLPLAFLLVGSFKGAGGVSLEPIPRCSPAGSTSMR